MSNEFDVAYDNVASKSAPALDDYEKSVFLTRSMYKIVDMALASYEANAQSQEILKKLIETYETSSPLDESVTRKRLVSNAVFYPRSSKVYSVRLEQATLNSSDPLLNGRTAEVIPVSYDKFHRTVRNPFLGPQNNTVLRANSGLEAATDVVQLIPPANATIEKYSIVYVRKPAPIILSDLSQTYPNENLSVYGKTAPYSSTEATDVSEIVHRQIVNEAVVMAILHYKENSLSNNVNLK
jgi:hypothetical protein